MRLLWTFTNSNENNLFDYRFLHYFDSICIFFVHFLFISNSYLFFFILPIRFRLLNLGQDRNKVRIFEYFHHGYDKKQYWINIDLWDYWKFELNYTFLNFIDLVRTLSFRTFPQPPFFGCSLPSIKFACALHNVLPKSKMQVCVNF